jgi:hypothetical protein
MYTEVKAGSRRKGPYKEKALLVQGPLRAIISRPTASPVRRGGALLEFLCRPAQEPDGEEAYFFLAFLVAFFFVAFLAVFFLAATLIHSPFEGNFP